MTFTIEGYPVDFDMTRLGFTRARELCGVVYQHRTLAPRVSAWINAQLYLHCGPVQCDSATCVLDAHVWRRRDIQAGIVFLDALRDMSLATPALGARRRRLR